MRLSLVLLFLSCSARIDDVDLTVPARHASCSNDFISARTDAGDDALCTVPRALCDGATEIISVSQCHYPPSASPAVSCCDMQPSGCALKDCDCLLRNGPWIDSFIAADAGAMWPDYQGDKRVCSYRVSCTPGTDGGSATLSCTSA